jgi:hypothetical protein
VIWWVLFTTGLAVSLVMVFRSQVEGDTLNMLARGWRFAFAGEWLQYGMPTSAGGKSPGGLLSLLVGLPLVVWADYRAPALLVWLLGVLGYLILDSIVCRVLGPSWRLLFGVLYWLNPWRIHFTSFLWNPNYMFVFGALHLWAAYQLRHRRRFWPSLVFVLIVGMAIQLHTSAMVLAVMSMMLWWRGLVRLRWSGVVTGGIVTVASLLPWIIAVVQRPELFPGGTGFPFRNLLLIQPALRGLMYLVRYPSLALPRQVYELDLVPGGTGDDLASSMLVVVLVGMGWLTVLMPLWAYRRFFRRARPLWRRREWPGADRLWLRGYLVWSLVGAALAFAASPTSVMFWQGFPAFHVTTLVVVLMVGTLGRTRRGPVTRRLVVGWAVLSLLVAGVIGQSSPMFQRSAPPPATSPPGGNVDFAGRLAGDHPMFHDLGIMDRCGVIVVGEGGFWPDALPAPSLESDAAAEQSGARRGVGQPPPRTKMNTR